jgi:hypothetical protein
MEPVPADIDERAGRGHLRASTSGDRLINRAGGYESSKETQSDHVLDHSSPIRRDATSSDRPGNDTRIVRAPTTFAG